jgi:hypothetical protein
MYLLSALLWLTGVFPLMQALRANRPTTLRQPLWWAAAAWLAWTCAAGSPVVWPGQDVRLAHYLALCLTGCAGVAVLGARRPGVGAWNFVVGGLLAVLLLPVLNGLGELRLEPVHRLFLLGTLAVSLLNYLPTRLWPAVVLLGAGCILDVAELDRAAPSERAGQLAALVLAGLAPWAAWASLSLRHAPRTEFDQVWLAYRDRYGFVWGQRMREQFNRAAYHAGWPVVLRWTRLHTGTSEGVPDAAALTATLRAVLKRFGPAEDIASDQRPL